MVSEPELLILDEPFSGLDPVNADALKDAVLELRVGATIVFSTHDMSAAERLCDRIFMIFKGNKVLDGTLAEIQDAVRRRHRARADGGGRARARGLPGVDKVVDHGQPQELRAHGRPAGVPARAGRRARPCTSSSSPRLPCTTSSCASRVLGRRKRMLHRILLIAKRDYVASVMRKAFLFGLVFAPLLFGGGLFGIAVLRVTDGNKEKEDRHPR